jgi:hypothetical protein
MARGGRAILGRLTGKPEVTRREAKVRQASDLPKAALPIASMGQQGTGEVHAPGAVLPRRDPALIPARALYFPRLSHHAELVVWGADST